MARNTPPTGFEFHSDRRRGEPYEDMYEEALRGFGFKVTRARGNHPIWDMKAEKPNATLFYEVKADFKCNLTGNVAIEYKYNGNASGIATTEADIWVEIIVFDRPLKAHEVLVSELRAFIESCPDLRCEPTGQAARSYLLDFRKQYKTIPGCRTLFLNGRQSYYER